MIAFDGAVTTLSGAKSREIVATEDPYDADVRPTTAE
jgi:hypothetical protein